MFSFFTHWTKKKVIIVAASLAALTTASIGVYTLLGSSGGKTNVDLPTDEVNGVYEKPENGTVADFTDDPKKNLYIANGVLIKAGSFRSETNGKTVSTKVGFSVTQDIHAVRAVTGNSVFKESSSFGLVKMGEQRFVSGDSYLYRLASKVKAADDVIWKEDAPAITDEKGYNARYGCRGTGLSLYILNDETINEAAYVGRDDDGYYSFSYVLDNDKATPQILYEMRNNSGSKNFATFSKAKITVSMDENWVIHSFETDCEYNVPIAGNTPCKERTTEIFSDIGKIKSVEELPEYEYFSKYLSHKPVDPGDDDSKGDEAPDAISTLAGMFGKYLNGEPLNVALSADFKGNSLNADLSVFLDLENLNNIAVRAQTANGITATYASENLLLKLNDVKLKLTIAEIKQFIEKISDSSEASGESGGLLDKFGDLDIDPSEILDSITCETTETSFTARIPLTLGEVEIVAELNGKPSGDGYEFTDAKVTVGNILTATLTATNKTVAALESDSSYVNICDVANDYYDAVKDLIAVSNDENNVNRAYQFAIAPLNLDLGKAQITTEKINAKFYYSQNKLVLDLDRLAARASVNGKDLGLNFNVKLAVENVENQTATFANDGATTSPFEAFAKMLSSRKVLVTVTELSSGKTFNISVSGSSLAECLTARENDILTALPQLEQIVSGSINIEKILGAVNSLTSVTYDGENDKKLSLTVSAENFVKNLGLITVTLSQPENSGIKLEISQTKNQTVKNLAALSVKAAGAPTASEIEAVYDFEADHRDIGDVNALVTKVEKLLKLVPVVTDYLNGAPLDFNLAASFKGIDLAAKISALVDFDNLANTAVALETPNGVKLTYAKEQILFAVNQLNLKLSVDDIKFIAQKFGKKIPEINVSDIFDKIDIFGLIDGIEITETENSYSLKLPINIGELNVAVAVNCNISDGKYTLASIGVTAGDILSATLTPSEISVEPLDENSINFIDAGAVFNDYSGTLEELIDFGNDEQERAKGWTFDLAPLSLTYNGKSYSTEQSTIKLYYSADKTVISIDKLTITSEAGGKTSSTELSVKAAYEKVSKAAENQENSAEETSESSNATVNLADERRLFITVNDLKNPQSDLKFTISGKALKTCIDNRLPELLDAIPQLKELLQKKINSDSLLDLSANISSLTYDRENDKKLSLTLNAEKILGGGGSFEMAISQPENGKLKLEIRQIGEAAISVNYAGISVISNAEKPSRADIDAAYDTTAAHIDLDSIDTLLQSFVLTAKRASFRLTGNVPVDLNALGIVKAKVNLGIDVKVDIERTEGQPDVVFVTGKLSRGKLSGITKSAFNDYGGDSYIFYDGEAKTITVMRNSLRKWCKKCGNLNCSNTTLHAAWRTDIRSDMEAEGVCSYSVTQTEDEFAENIVDNILEMVNFIDDIKNAITGAMNGEDKAAFGIDDVIKNYGYSDGQQTYSVALDLKPIDSVLGSANIYIKHDDDAFNLSALTGNVKLLDITGVSCTGTFAIDLIDSVDGDARNTAVNRILY